MYPLRRLRRNRQYSWLRDLVSETNLSPSNLILPLFIIEGINKKVAIKTMPGVERLSIDLALQKAQEASDLGINAVALFPVVTKEKKSCQAEEAYNYDNLICKAIRHFKENKLLIGIISDVALDPYTTHGHDGILAKNSLYIDNDATLTLLSKQAISLVKSGADIIAPSDMMDGRVKVIREMLDIEGYSNVPILSYAAKYASSFYSPFRQAIGSCQSSLKLSKSTYQMDYRNIREALEEISLDINEGADMIVVKPSMMYLDVIHYAASKSCTPILAYQTSGEYSMIKYAALNDSIDFYSAMLESLFCMRRAGARAIFTYAAIEIARYLRKFKQEN